MDRSTSRVWIIAVSALWLLAIGAAAGRSRFDRPDRQDREDRQDNRHPKSQDPIDNAANKVKSGQRIFRFDTFGDEAFWGDTLKLHQAIEGARFGGVGPGVSHERH